MNHDLDYFFSIIEENTIASWLSKDQSYGRILMPFLKRVVFVYPILQSRPSAFNHLIHRFRETWIAIRLLQSTIGCFLSWQKAYYGIKRGLRIPQLDIFNHKKFSFWLVSKQKRSRLCTFRCTVIINHTFCMCVLCRVELHIACPKILRSWNWQALRIKLAVTFWLN